LQIVKSPYLNDVSSDFDEIWGTNTAIELDDITYMEIFKIQDGGQPPFKNIFGHNSAAHCPISVKFCTGRPK